MFDRHTPLPDKLADWLLRPVRNFQAAQTDREIEQTLSEQGDRPLRRNEPALDAYECLYAIAANHDFLQPSVFERSNGVFDFAVDQGRWTANPHKRARTFAPIRASPARPLGTVAASTPKRQDVLLDLALHIGINKVVTSIR